MIRFVLGELRLSVLDAGTLWLDGGAMFGVVPRVIWEKRRTPDESHRICLASNLLLIEDGRRRTLVDTGAGTKQEKKARELYRIQSKSASEFLAPAGLTPGQIDQVVLSHLHFDHAGGGTVSRDDGSFVAAFPNAEYIVQRGELETARLDHEKIRAAYFAEDFEPLTAEPGRLRMVEGPCRLSPGIELLPAPGHTPHMQIVLVRTGEGTLAFLADLVPMTDHVRFPYIMAFDLEPMRTMETKKTLLRRAAAERWSLLFEHDPITPLGTLADEGGTWRARPWSPGGA